MDDSRFLIEKMWEDSRDPSLKCYKEIQVRIPYLEKIPQKFEVK